MSSDLHCFEDVVSGNNEPLWGQSYYYNLYDPTTRIGCLIRVGLQENRKEANSWLIVFKDGSPVFTRTNLNLPYTAERPKQGINIAGMHIQAIESLTRTRITFADGDFALDLQWDALHPIADCIAMTADKEGSFAREMAHVHLEGPCKVSGQVTIRNERTDVAGTGFRDIAAGIRNWDALHHYRLAWPIFENGMAFSGIHGISTGGNSAYMRMFHDGKEWLRVTDIEDRNEYAPDPFTVSTMEWSFVDEKGRKFQFTAKPLFRWLFAQDSFVICEQMMEYRLSDGTLGYGLCEGGFRLPWTGEEH